MYIVNISEAKTNLSSLVERAANGEEIIITRKGRAMARLVPLEKRTKPRKLGGYEGVIAVGEDFDAPLPDIIIMKFRGEA
jgi:prevent-host-death family protein